MRSHEDDQYHHTRGTKALSESEHPMIATIVSRSTSNFLSLDGNILLTLPSILYELAKIILLEQSCCYAHDLIQSCARVPDMLNNMCSLCIKKETLYAGSKECIGGN